MSRAMPLHLLLTASLFMLVTLGGCATPALTGLTLETRIKDDRIVGTWVAVDDGEEDGEEFTIVQMEDEVYEIRAPGEDGKTLFYKITLHLFQGGLFVDMTLPDRTIDDLNDDHSWLLIPVHMFARLELEDGRARAWALDEEWVDQQTQSKVIATTEFPGTDAPPLIAATPSALEKLLTRAAKDPAAWMHVMEFKRVR